MLLLRFSFSSYSERTNLFTRMRFVLPSHRRRCSVRSCYLLTTMCEWSRLFYESCNQYIYIQIYTYERIFLSGVRRFACLVVVFKMYILIFAVQLNVGGTHCFLLLNFQVFLRIYA